MEQQLCARYYSILGTRDTEFRDLVSGLKEVAVLGENG
jgi:hypothetical protein